MNQLGNFKTGALVRLIIIIYSLTQAAIFGIFLGLKSIERLVQYHSVLNNWEYWLAKLLPVLVVVLVLSLSDRFFDKIPKFLASFLYDVPIIKGEYKGIAKQKDGKNYDVIANFEQTLSVIEFKLWTPQGSVSTSESISYQKIGMYEWTIYVNYYNINKEIPEDTNEYKGAVILNFDSRKNELSGIYFTQKQIFGTVKLIKT